MKHVQGHCDRCHRGCNTRRGLCTSCYGRAKKDGTLPPLDPAYSTIELVNEVIMCGTRNPLDLCEALRMSPDALARRLHRFANQLEWAARKEGANVAS